MSDENEVTTVEQLSALPLGTWIIDAKDEAWALFDTAVLFRQRMWRSKNGHSFVAHEGIPLPAGLADIDADCEHVKLTIEGWQCARCAVVVNEPPEPEPQPKPEKGRAWFYSDGFGDWIGVSPDFDNIIALAQDVLARPHDQAAKDRYAFEVAPLMVAISETETDDEEGNAGYPTGYGLSLIISHLVERISRDRPAGVEE